MNESETSGLKQLRKMHNFSIGNIVYDKSDDTDHEMEVKELYGDMVKAFCTVCRCDVELRYDHFTKKETDWDK